MTPTIFHGAAVLIALAVTEYLRRSGRISAAQTATVTAALTAAIAGALDLLRAKQPQPVEQATARVRSWYDGIVDALGDLVGKNDETYQALSRLHAERR